MCFVQFFVLSCLSVVDVSPIILLCILWIIESKTVSVSFSCNIYSTHVGQYCQILKLCMKTSAYTEVTFEPSIFLFSSVENPRDLRLWGLTNQLGNFTIILEYIVIIVYSRS